MRKRQRNKKFRIYDEESSQELQDLTKRPASRLMAVFRDAVLSAAKTQVSKKGKNGGKYEVKITVKDVEKAFSLLHENMEPCYQADWRREPWPERPYQAFQDYVIAEDVQEDVDRRLLESGLRTHQQTGNDPLMLGTPVGPHVNMRLERFPKRCRMGEDVKESCVWGLDCFTRRLVHDCLGLCPELMSDPSPGTDVRSDFIEKHLLAALNSLGNRGWNMFEAMETIQRKGEGSGNRVLALTAERMGQIMQCVELREWVPKKIGRDGRERLVAATDNFRAYPKGQGVICCRKGGLPKGTFVEEYLGEVYTPWRWFERQDAIKKLHPDGELPDFYNILIERPRDDDKGYGAIFVEGANRGNYASRLCHSCNPNCQTVSLCAEGRVTNAMFTVRHVEEGEELTWDYSCVTESEKEFRVAICLCGTSRCRGSFLSYAASSAFRDVISAEHTFLDRTALLLRACEDPLTEADKQRLQRNGIKNYALCMSAEPGDCIPGWLTKWASLILEFVEYEREQLPSKLMARCAQYNQSSAEVEANGVRTHRLQNLVITLDKARYFLRQQNDTNPPVRFLTDDEIVEHLWTGQHSVVLKALAALEEYQKRLRSNEKAFQAALNRDNNRSCDEEATEGTLSAMISELTAFVKEHEIKTPDQARDGMYKICDALRSTDNAHAALHDLLLLKASTRFYVRARTFRTVTSAPVNLSDMDVPKTPNGVASNKKRKQPDRKLYCKRYKSEFLWAQLVAWFKQTVYDPTASLGAERRGCVCLPSVDNCYADQVIDGRYMSEHRPKMLDIMEQKSQSQWPKGMIWNFKNEERIYGSPMLDFAIERGRGDTDSGANFKAMLQKFKSAFDQTVQDPKHELVNGSNDH